MLLWFLNPGQKVCEKFNIKGEHRMIARTFVNMHWYGVVEC
jgi:hypothetical protein